MKSFATLALLLPSALAFEYLIGVGKDETTGQKGVGFDPSVIYPIPGDDLIFEFLSGEHSVIQSTFELPCTHNGGFDSGVFEVPETFGPDADGLPRSTFRVNSTEPTWFFDRASGDCHRGAVLAVNPSASQTPALFRENASKDSGVHPSAGASSTASGTAADSEPSETPDSAASSMRAVSGPATVLASLLAAWAML